jgi:hypothetical protein
MREHLPLTVLEQDVKAVPDQRNETGVECHPWHV